MIHPVVKWIKIFSKFIAVAPKIFTVSTMAGNLNFRNRNEVAGEEKKLEWQGLGDVCTWRQLFRVFQTAVVRMLTRLTFSYVENSKLFVDWFLSDLL